MGDNCRHENEVTRSSTFASNKEPSKIDLASFSWARSTKTAEEFHCRFICVIVGKIFINASYFEFPRAVLVIMNRLRAIEANPAAMRLLYMAAVIGKLEIEIFPSR